MLVAHIENVVACLGSLKSNINFKDAFHKYLMGCNSDEEFKQCCWDNMVTTYKKDNEEVYKWVDHLYKIQHKWCTCMFEQKYLLVGILSSQRSKSTNNVLDFEAKKTKNLTQFFKIFEI